MEIAAAKPVSYTKQVGTAASLEEFVAFLTSQQPKRDNSFSNVLSQFVCSP
jgi:hypothetical protein